MILGFFPHRRIGPAAIRPRQPILSRTLNPEPFIIGFTACKKNRQKNPRPFSFRIHLPRNNIIGFNKI